MEIDYKQTKLTRGLDKLNKRFGCPETKELIVIFGLMSSGKTEYTYFVSRKNAELGNKVCYISLELPEYQMKLRIARKRAGINKYDFQKQQYTDIQKDIMEKSFKEIQDMENLKIVSLEEKTLVNIDRIIRTYEDQGYKMFIIDNLDKIVANGNEDENRRYQRITSALQDLKNNNDLCIMLIHHAKKPDSRSAYGKSGLSGLRGSQKIMDNATQVFEIYRDLDPDSMNKSEVEIIQIKDTFEGNNGAVSIYFNKGEYQENEPQSF